MKLLIALILLIGICNADEFTLRGWIMFNNDITASAYSNEVTSRIIKAKKDYYVVGISSTTELAPKYRKHNFNVVYYNKDFLVGENLYTFIKGIKFSPDVIDYKIEIIYSHNDMLVGTCIPDVIKEVFKK